MTAAETTPPTGRVVNPIIRKEVLSALRTRKAVLMQGLFLLVLAALVWLLWPPQGLQDIGGRQSRTLLNVVSIGTLVMVILLAPAFTAGALTSEKERNTIESLFTTFMKPWEIALGKIVGSLCFLLLLVLTAIPALCTPLLLGGVTGSEILARIAVLLLTAIYLGTIGLAVSAFMHRSYRSMIVTYAILLALCFAVALPAWPVSQHMLRRGGETWQAVLHTLASLSPLQAMLSLCWPGSDYDQGAITMPAFWIMFIPLSMAVVAGGAAVCMWKLRRPIAPPRPREALTVVERDMKITGRKVLYLWFLDPRRRKRHISWWKNPVLVKEFRTRPMLQTHWLLRTFGGCMIASVCLMLLVSASVSVLVAETSGLYVKIATAVAAMMVVLIVMIGPSISGGMVCSDRESGVWDLLRATPIHSWRIVSGKFQAAIIPLLLLVVATLPALLILLHFDMNLMASILRICAVVGMTVAFVVTAGVFFSSIFSRTSTATAWTYGLVVSLALVTPLALLAGDLFSQRMLEITLTVNPVIVAMEAAGESMTDSRLMMPHLKIIGTTTAVMFVIAVARVFQLRRAE
ncbi:MAG: ABC transporter permease subunit [Planctomycetes bacterium]|nr:ABC transporter permease subunit [Phycisphaerae bacterium]NBB95692.1 ABC transporter permease subunit [Planctomycetota bacterium]